MLQTVISPNRPGIPSDQGPPTRHPQGTDTLLGPHIPWDQASRLSTEIFTDDSEKITFPQTSFAGANKLTEISIYFILISKGLINNISL